MSVRKICVFLFVNCIFIFRIANTFVASDAMKYSEMFFAIRKFLAYNPPPPPPPPQLYMLATALVETLASLNLEHIYSIRVLITLSTIVFRY
jgi:hypothetical protein